MVKISIQNYTNFGACLLNLGLNMTNTILFPLIGTCVGLLLGRFVVVGSKSFLKVLLTFSGAFLLGIAFLDLWPAAYQQAPETTGYWVLGGLVLQLLLETWTQGAEHGHRHASKDHFQGLLWLGLCIHAFLEGLPLSFHPELQWGMLIHKIPISLVLYLLVYQQKEPPKMSWILLLSFALMTPLGGLLPSLVSELETYAPQITALVTGVLLHIATTIIFESDSHHKLQFQKLLGLFLGILAAILV